MSPHFNLTSFFLKSTYVSVAVLLFTHFWVVLGITNLEITRILNDPAFPYILNYLIITEIWILLSGLLKKKFNIPIFLSLALPVTALIPLYSIIETILDRLNLISGNLFNVIDMLAIIWLLVPFTLTSWLLSYLYSDTKH